MRPKECWNWSMQVHEDGSCGRCSYCCWSLQKLNSNIHLILSNTSQENECQVLQSIAALVLVDFVDNRLQHFSIPLHCPQFYMLQTPTDTGSKCHYGLFGNLFASVQGQMFQLQHISGNGLCQTLAFSCTTQIFHF